MSFSQRRVVDDAPKECGGAEHVVSKVTYLAVCFLDHPKIFENILVKIMGFPKFLLTKHMRTSLPTKNFDNLFLPS